MPEVVALVFESHAKRTVTEVTARELEVRVYNVFLVSRVIRLPFNALLFARITGHLKIDFKHIDKNYELDL